MPANMVLGSRCSENYIKFKKAVYDIREISIKYKIICKEAKYTVCKICDISVQKEDVMSFCYSI